MTESMPSAQEKKKPRPKDVFGRALPTEEQFEVLKNAPSDYCLPNEENRLKRDDHLMAILAQTNPSEPLKWELKQKPGMSPPCGGFNPDDPNQQIVAEDIFDEYGAESSELFENQANHQVVDF